MSLHVWDSGEGSAAENMAMDEGLLKGLAEKPECVLHLYSWQHKSATFGYFTDPSQFLDVKRVNSEGVELARRPTGGGIIFHLTDLAFSLVIPNSHPKLCSCTLNNYKLVNQAVSRAIVSFTGGTIVPGFFENENNVPGSICQHFCMAKPTVYDVMLDGRKVGGAAQRRTKHGLLHQGSICLALPDFAWLETLFQPNLNIIEAMRRNSYPLIEIKELRAARQSMTKYLIDELSQII